MDNRINKSSFEEVIGEDLPVDFCEIARDELSKMGPWRCMEHKSPGYANFVFVLVQDRTCKLLAECQPQLVSIGFWVLFLREQDGPEE